MHPIKSRSQNTSFKKTIILNEIYFPPPKKTLKRISSLMHSNSLTMQDKPLQLQLFLLAMETLPHQRTEQELQIVAKVLKQQSIFPEFKHSLTILRYLAGQITLKQLQAYQLVYSCDSRDDNLYKLFRGEVALWKENQLTHIIKHKGELLQQFQEFKSTKDIEAQCRQQCLLIALSHRAYEDALGLEKENISIMQMLAKTSLFSRFKRKELLHVIENCLQLSLSCKEVLFSQGDLNTGHFYFLIQGELAVLKSNNQHKKQVVCYLTNGSFIGQESLFWQARTRLYTVSAHSSLAKILQISCSKLHETIKHFELNVSQILTPKYQDFLRLREKHYVQQLEQNSGIRLSFQPPKYQHKMSPVKHQRITNMLKDVENVTLQLNQKEKILQKRYNIGKEYKDCRLISVERPLFGREDFPALKQLIKRYGINQAKAKENCKFPLL